MTTQIMYDSVDMTKIPAGARLVAAYVNGSYANVHQAHGLFPDATIVEISVTAHEDSGDVLDVERYDAGPEEAPAWVALRRRAGVIAPAVYCSLDTWPECIAAFRQQQIADPLWWIAHYDDRGDLSVGMFAKQYQNTPHYDLSIVAGPWPGLQTDGDLVLPSDIDQIVAKTTAGVLAGIQGGPVRDALAFADLWWLDHALAGTTTAAMSTAQAALVRELHTLIGQLGARPAGGAATDGATP